MMYRKIYKNDAANIIFDSKYNFLSTDTYKWNELLSSLIINMMQPTIIEITMENWNGIILNLYLSNRIIIKLIKAIPATKE